MVRGRRSDVLRLQTTDTHPAQRRADVRALLRQQISRAAAWRLVIDACRGRTQDWVDQYVLTDAVLELVPDGKTTALWQTRLSAATGFVQTGYVGWHVAQRTPVLNAITAVVARMITRVLARYLPGFALGSALFSTGLGSWIGGLIDTGCLALAVHDVWAMRDNLIESLLEVWYGTE